MKFSVAVFATLLSLVSVQPIDPSFSAPNPNRYIIEATTAGNERLQPKAIGTSGKYAVVEFENEAAAEEFRLGNEMWPDSPMYYLHDEGIKSASAFQEVPYGIAKVFNNADTLTVEFPSTLPVISKEICIIDSGYQLDHPDLPASATAADPGQGSTGSSLYYGTDGCEHGTHVAGTILATDNTEGVLGVFPGAKSKVVRTFANNCGWAYTSQLIDAIERCKEDGAKIVTMSLGSYSSFPGLCTGIEDMTDNDNMLIIAAAGNGGGTSFFYPASCEDTVSVGATDSSDTIASFSQHNSQVDISAPGVDVKSTTGSSSYSVYSGTSMAAPHVAGVALLLWNQYPRCANTDIREALEQGATDKGIPGRDDYYGHGIVNYHEAVKYLKSRRCATVIIDDDAISYPTDDAVPADEAKEWFASVFDL